MIFAGNHGVVARGVSAFPASVTAQMVANFSAGGAAINALAAVAGLALDVVALDLERPTADFTRAPAMTEDDCLAAINAGADAVSGDLDLLVLGEMGIGNSTAAAALCNASFGGIARDWVGPGTGVDGAGIARKIATVEAGLARHRDHLGDPFEILRRLGGREIAAIAGAVVAARMRRVAVVLDGFICSSAVAPLAMRRPGIVEHLVAGHVSAEPGHARLLAKLGLEPLLRLDMRLGEGSGAAVAVASSAPLWPRTIGWPRSPRRASTAGDAVPALPDAAWRAGHDRADAGPHRLRGDAGGIDRSREQARDLPVARIVSSDLLRARACAEAIGAATIDARWREIDFGEWDGLAASKIDSDTLARFWNDPDGHPPPGGERWSALVIRVAEAVASLKAEPTLVVTHGGAMRAALSALCGFDPARTWAFELTYATVLALKVWPGEPRSAQIAGLWP